MITVTATFAFIQKPSRMSLQRQRQLYGRFTSSSLWFLMPRTKSWRFLSNIRSMLPLTIFRAMSIRDSYRYCPAGVSSLQKVWWWVKTDPLHRFSSTRVPWMQGPPLFAKARADEAEARWSVPCRTETLAMDECRKWLTKWRPVSAD